MHVRAAGLYLQYHPKKKINKKDHKRHACVSCHVKHVRASYYKTYPRYETEFTQLALHATKFAQCTALFNFLRKISLSKLSTVSIAKMRITMWLIVIFNDLTFGRHIQRYSLLTILNSINTLDFLFATLIPHCMSVL